MLDNINTETIKDIKTKKAIFKSQSSILDSVLNKFLLKTLMKKLKIPSEKIIYSIDSFGNTNAASIPITIFKNLKNKENVKLLVSGFGVGYSWASAIINLNKPKFTTLNKI